MKCQTCEDGGEKLYGMDVWETLTDSLEDAVERHLLDVLEIGQTASDRPDLFPLRILVFRCMKVPEITWQRMAEHTLENILRDLDEDFGGEDKTEPTKEMTAAAQAFMEAVRREYKPWQCKPTGEVVEVTLAQAMEMFE